MRKEWPGATHASEIPYVCDTVGAHYGAALTQVNEKMAQTLLAYWIPFAKTGNPDGAGLTEWPRYAPENDVLMNFTGSASRSLEGAPRPDAKTAIAGPPAATVRGVTLKTAVTPCQ